MTDAPIANDHDPIGTALGFTHGVIPATEPTPCTEGDAGLFFAEKYVGVETRRIVKFEAGTITLNADAESDETDSMNAQWVECWRCNGAKVLIDDAIELDFS